MSAEVCPGVVCTADAEGRGTCAELQTEGAQWVSVGARLYLQRQGIGETSAMDSVSAQQRQRGALA